MKHIIIGGVAGGATAAARIRRIDEQAEIIILEKGKYISYANCGLPYYIGGTIQDRSKLFVQTPEAFSKRFKAEVRTENEAIDIDPGNKTVTVKDATGKTYKESYDKLLLSPGSTAVKPPLKGIDTEGIFTLRNVDDTDRIKEYIGSHNIDDAVVVGGGFIGLEMAENLQNAGARVSVVEMADQVMAPVDFSTASIVHRHLVQKGVGLYLNCGVDGFEKAGDRINVTLKDGRSIEADIVILSIGVRPETALAQKAGLEIGEAHGIKVSDYLETSSKDIYAVGDAIEFPNPITGKPYLNLLANPANRQARIVADNMVLSNKEKYEGALGTSIAKVFDLTVASTGLAAKKLKQLGIEYRSSITHSFSHANYYPDSLPLTLKLTFDPHDGKLFGAQCVGYDGVDKRIDEIAMVLKKGGSVYDLMQTEHCYAPPFSAAKDPVAIAGYVAGNIINGSMPAVTWRDLQAADRKSTFILDVRTAAEFSFGAVDGAVNIPLDDLRDRLAEVPKDRPVFVYCAVGLRGYLAVRILLGNGFKNVWNVSGGYSTYATATAKTENTAVRSNAKSSAREEAYASISASESHSDSASAAQATKTLRVDACGLQCPGPIMKVKQAVDTMAEGDRLEVTATDAGFSRDAGAWCDSTGNRLLSNSEERGKYTVVIEKGGKKECRLASTCDDKNKTFIMFSDDLDKALATFVLANGAAATGHKTTIFFTFWGLNVIKKVKKPKVKKDIFGKMFGMMLASSSLKLHLSKMSMFGIGDKMMRKVMRLRGIESLENLRSQALAAGVEFIACQMSMDVMGVAREELLDEVTVGGVATYMNRAEQANVNLFI